MKTRKIFSCAIHISLKTFLVLLLLGQGGIYPLSALAEEDFFEALHAGRLSERMEISDFTLPSSSGGEVKLSDFKGKIVFLNFWATWCQYCRMERPSLQAMYDKYKDKGLVVLAVSIDRAGIETVKKYVVEHNLTFPNLHDQTSKVALEYGIRGVPTTFFIDSTGKVVGGVIGPRAWDSKEAYGLVEQLLAEGNGMTQEGQNAEK